MVFCRRAPSCQQSEQNRTCAANLPHLPPALLSAGVFAQPRPKPDIDRLATTAGAVQLRLTRPGRILRFPRRRIMKLALIAMGLLATTGVVYAACVFC